MFRLTAEDRIELRQDSKTGMLQPAFGWIASIVVVTLMRALNKP
jgi:hypothetical protein